MVTTSQTDSGGEIGSAPSNDLNKITVTFLPQPMVLITQIQRSGGTLLSQLLDGHPQICAHPHELHIGRPAKWNWPNLNMGDLPEAWFASLYEKRLERFYDAGYVKPGSNPYAGDEVHPYSFNPAIQQNVFMQVLERVPVHSQRDILNAFFTSFFAAWSDVSVGPDSKFISAFCPRVLMIQDSTERFIRDYPDGHFVSSVRDPRTWYASTRRHNKSHNDVRNAIPEWKQSTEDIIRLKKERPGYIFVATYEQLVTETEATVRKMATFLGLDFQDSLLMPTYLSKPILPNSSYARNSYGVNAQSTKTAADLSEEDRLYIEREAMPLYEEAAALAAG